MIKIHSVFNYGSKMIKSDLEANEKLTKELYDITLFLTLFCRDFRFSIQLSMSIKLTSSEEIWE